MKVRVFGLGFFALVTALCAGFLGLGGGVLAIWLAEKSKDLDTGVTGQVEVGANILSVNYAAGFSGSTRLVPFDQGDFTAQNVRYIVYDIAVEFSAGDVDAGTSFAFKLFPKAGAEDNGLAGKIRYCVSPAESFDTGNYSDANATITALKTGGLLVDCGVNNLIITPAAAGVKNYKLVMVLESSDNADMKKDYKLTLSCLEHSE